MVHQLTQYPDGVRIDNLVAGKIQRPIQGRYKDRQDPADRSRVTSTAPLSTASDVAAAVDAAVKAAVRWNHSTIASRVEVISSFIDHIERRRGELVGMIVAEVGKPAHEAHVEVERSLQEARSFFAIAASLDDQQTDSGLVQARPLGTVGLITAWNFPLAIICRKLIPALLAGNTVVIKPSELAPGAAAILGAAACESGLPDGVVNIVYGTGPEAGAHLIDDQRIAAVSFTGSTSTGRGFAPRLAARGARIQLEMGGKNAAIVLADADLDRVCVDLAAASFTCSGQWCTGTGLVVAHEPIADELVDRLHRLVDGIRVGDGRDSNTTMGPLIEPAAVERVSDLLKPLDGGALYQPELPELPVGNYLAPAIVHDVAIGHRLSTEELFAPVLVVHRADDLDAALSIVERSRYGLSSSIYTDDIGAQETYLRRARTGLVHVNLPTPFRGFDMPSGGWGDSGDGEPESSSWGLRFFTRHRAVYRLSGPFRG